MLRIVTYNVHKCQGLDRRMRPARIASVLRELDADVIALQEVVCHAGGDAEMDQAKFIAAELGYEYCLGENRKHRGAAYGNVVLSRLPWGCVENYDITWRGRESRGALRVDVQLDDGAGGQLPLHLFNVHLGTAYIERRHQARQLVGEKILRRPDLDGVRVVLGDFNEFPRGLATRLSITSTSIRRSNSRGCGCTRPRPRSSPPIICHSSPTSNCARRNAPHNPISHRAHRGHRV
jgi:endonuclease/exonuclease/phosphatase family metal-dependent hydrolase